MRRILSVLMLTAAVAACSDSTGPGSTVTVDVADDVFSPSELTIDAGTTVRWVWVGTRTHNVVFAGGASASPDQASGSWSRTFSTPGAYSYSCTHHAMTGQITVR